LIPSGFFEPSSNAIRDPGFESGVLFADERSVESDVVDVTEVVSDTVITGSYSLKLGAAGGGAVTGEAPDQGIGAIVGVGWRVNAEPGETVLAAANVAYVTAGAASVAIDVRDSSDSRLVLVGSPSVTAIAKSGRPTMGLVCPAYTDTVILWARISGVETGWYAGAHSVDAGGNTGWVFGDAPSIHGHALFDDLLLVRNAVYVVDGFHGESGGAEWDGPRYFSSSTRFGEADALSSFRDAMPGFYFDDPTYVTEPLTVPL
jgi:hypothetical protein